MFNFLETHIALISLFAGNALTFALFILNLHSRVNRHEAEIEALKEAQKSIELSRSSDSKEIKDELKRVASNVENLKISISEMVGYFRGKGHDIKSCE